MDHSTRAHRIAAVFAIVASLAAPAVAVAGADVTDLELALKLLPRVDRFEVDRSGRLTVLEGKLTPPGQSPPRRAATAFLAVHAQLFSAAEGSVFVAEQNVESGGESSVLVRQLIDGFRVEQEHLRLDFDASGSLVRLAGVVLGDGDVVPAEGQTLQLDGAVEIALSTTGREGRAEAIGARRVILDGRRCWRVELRRDQGRGSRSTIVTLDALDGNVVGVRDSGAASFGELPLARPRPKQGRGISGCTPLAPSVGDFDSPEGQQLWSGANTGCGRWEFDPKENASLFHGNCLEYVCDPYPATDQCDHGEIRRGRLFLESGYELVRLEVVTPDREIFMRLRWGPSILDAAPFLIPASSATSTVVELDLAGFDSWDSSQIDELTLELVDDSMVWLLSLDLSPGPWLELARGPEVAAATPGGPLVSGEPATVLQDVRNLGCALDAGTHHEMRSVSYRLYEVVGAGRGSETAVCDGAQISGAIAAESSVRNLPMCTFQLPAAGTWLIEGQFDVHPAPVAVSTFVVQPAVVPDVSVDLSRPVDLYSGWLAQWPCRSDVLDRARYDDPNPPCNLPYIVTLETAESGLTEPVTSEIEVWARPRDPATDPTVCDPDSGGWYPLGDPVQQTFGLGSAEPVALPLERTRVMALPLGADGWALVDLKIAIDPVPGEVDIDDNRACIAAWLPVIDGELSSAMGPTWVADDYFLDPEHWPPDGLTWIGVTVVHVEGWIYYEPDKAMLVLSVEDGANEPPRLVWFEVQEGRTVAGLVLRYRRAEAGYGGPPFLDGGCAESAGLPDFELDVPGHPNRSSLVADSQWRTVAWRRGDAAPFGTYPVPQLVSPLDTGPVLSLHLAPDDNCLLDEPGCPSGLRPETLIDVVAVWYADGAPIPEPLFSVDGLRVRNGDEWVQSPATVVPGGPVEYGVEVRNVGNAGGIAVLTAEVTIEPLNEGPVEHVMTGSQSVPIAAGSSHVLQLEPIWLPDTVGLYRIYGTVWESSLEIGEISETVEVLDTGPGCPTPTASLP